MEHQFKPWQPVIVRYGEKEKWSPNFFCYHKAGHDYPFVCIGGVYQQCLPAKGNRHLIGTTDSPALPEPEFKFGDKVKVLCIRNVWKRAIFIQTETGAEGFVYKVRFDNDTFGLFTKHHIRHADW